MKFVILIFTILVNIKLSFTRYFDVSNSIASKNSPFSMPIFLEKKSFSKQAYRIKKNRSYKMKITIIKDIDKENDAPLVVKGNIKMDKNFEIYDRENNSENKISFIK